MILNHKKRVFSFIESKNYLFILNLSLKRWLKNQWIREMSIRRDFRLLNNPSIKRNTLVMNSSDKTIKWRLIELM